MRKNIKLTSLVMALLLLAAGCDREDNMPGAGTEGGIALTPAVELAGGWSTGADTRADQKVPVILAPGGKMVLGLGSIGADGNPDEGSVQINFFEVTADGKLSRLPFSGVEGESEEPLNVAAPGEYLISCYGEANLTTDGITYRSYLYPINIDMLQKVTIGADGKFSLPVRIYSAGLRLNVKGMDGTAYTGADVTATLKNLGSFYMDGFETKTLTAAAPSVIWGDITSDSAPAGTQLLELVVGGKTYKVNAPRQISFTEGRLYTFNVRVGATSITVSSDDLSVGDFEVQASTATEAEQPPYYNGQPANLLAIPGQTAYWVAPENAAAEDWNPNDVDIICPEGWHVPTKEEFLAMTGIPSEDSESANNFAAISAVFPDNIYRSATPYDMVISYGLTVNSGTGKAVIRREENRDMVTRCVRKK